MDEIAEDFAVVPPSASRIWRTDVAQFEYDEILVIVFDRDLPLGEGVFTMDFVRTLNDQMRGLYRRHGRTEEMLSFSQNTYQLEMDIIGEYRHDLGGKRNELAATRHDLGIKRNELAATNTEVRRE